MKAVLVHAQAPVFYIGAYGSECVQTPALDRLATESIVFDAHEADGGGPLQILRALSTGRHSFAGGAGAQFFDQLREAKAVAVLLSTRPDADRAGWSQALVFAGETRMSRIREEAQVALSEVADKSDWLFFVDLDRIVNDEEPLTAEQDVDLAEEDQPDSGDSASPDAELETEDTEEDELDSADSVDPEAEFEDEEAEEDEDAPKKSPEPEPEPIDAELEKILENQAVVAADVEDLDQFVGWLRTELERRGLWDDVLFIFTGPPGTADGDGLCSAGPPHPLRPSRTRLPLIMRLPGNANAGRRVPSLTQPVDLPATLLTLLNRPVPPEFHGKSLLPLRKGEPARPYAVAVDAANGGSFLALTTPAWKLLVLARPERETERWLFRHPEDRFGVNNFYQQHIDYADRLENCLQQYYTAASQPGPLGAPILPREHQPDEPSVSKAAVLNEPTTPG